MGKDINDNQEIRRQAFAIRSVYRISSKLTHSPSLPPSLSLSASAMLDGTNVSFIPDEDHVRQYSSEKSAEERQLAGLPRVVGMGLVAGSPPYLRM
jgi:hypothetical protein